VKLVGDGTLAIWEGRRGTATVNTSHLHAYVADGVTSAVVWCRTACRLLVWYRYIRAVSTFRAAHLPKHTASYAERTPRAPETRNCDMREELHHTGTHGT